LPARCFSRGALPRPERSRRRARRGGCRSTRVGKPRRHGRRRNPEVRGKARARPYHKRCRTIRQPPIASTAVEPGSGHLSPYTAGIRIARSKGMRTAFILFTVWSLSALADTDLTNVNVPQNANDAQRLANETQQIEQLSANYY